MNTFGKWLFALLILANIGLVLWVTGFRPDGAAVPEGPRPALHAEKLRLLNEPAPSRNARPATAKTEAGGACYRIGPFTEAAPADRAGAQLREMSLAYERRTEEQRVITGYRVYLPPLASRALAEKKRRDLNRLGFKDHSLMQEEGLQNAISLGTFSVEANARKRLRTLAAKKIGAQMQTLQQTRTLYWLYLSPVESPDATPPRLRETDWGSPGAGVEVVSCSAAP